MSFSLCVCACVMFEKMFLFCILYRSRTHRGVVLSQWLYHIVYIVGLMRIGTFGDRILFDSCQFWFPFLCHVFSGGPDRSCSDKTLLLEISPDISHQWGSGVHFIEKVLPNRPGIYSSICHICILYIYIYTYEQKTAFLQKNQNHLQWWRRLSDKDKGR